MTDKQIGKRGRDVGSDYFDLSYDTHSKYKLTDFLPLFNFDDYWCYKSSGKQKLIETYEEFLDFNYSKYVFYKKDLYNKEHIDEWIKFMVNTPYITKPVPPFHPSKIIIKK